MDFKFIVILLAIAHETVSYYYNPEENEDLLEGDIKVDGRKSIILRENARWPDAIVPYRFEPNLLAKERDKIQEAMRAFHEVSCIRFVPKIDEDKAYITFAKKVKNRCWSNSAGRSGKEQTINLGTPCYWVLGTIMHELMHNLGFMHEQNRSDRDEYVTILWDNIPKQSHANFKKSKELQQNVTYDYSSIMHYNRYAWSGDKPPRPTIEPKKKLGKEEQMGQRKGFSCKDILKLNLYYDCKNYIGKPIKSSYIFEGKCSGKAM